MGVALSCNDFLVKGTSPAKKKPIYAEMNINTSPILSYACLLKKMEKSGVLAISRMSGVFYLL